MSRLQLLAALCFLACAGPALAESGPSFFLGGIPVNEADPEHWATTLDRIGMNTAAVTVYARQHRWDDASLWFPREAPGTVAEIRAAKARGLTVVLILRVALDHAQEENKFLWHGMIMPSGRKELGRWFARYEEFVLHWAARAEELGVDILGVGSELNALTESRRRSAEERDRLASDYLGYQARLKEWTRGFREQLERGDLWVRGFPYYDSVDSFAEDRHRSLSRWARKFYLLDEPDGARLYRKRCRRLARGWTELIRRVRGRFSGRLTYAANFDSYDKLEFWRRLDLLGINAYFPLDGDVGLQDRWATIFDEIDETRRRERVDGQPVLFTEIGYTARRYSTVQPWSEGGFSILDRPGQEPRLMLWDREPPAPDERVRAIEALHRFHTESGSPLVGMLYWKLSTLAEHARVEPFMLHVGPDSVDPLQPVLLRFVQSSP